MLSHSDLTETVDEKRKGGRFCFMTLFALRRFEMTVAEGWEAVCVKHGILLAAR